MNTDVILPLILAAVALVMYVGMVIAAIVGIWRSRDDAWWVPLAWTVFVIVAPLLGAIAWFLVGPSVNERIRRASGALSPR